MTIKFNNNDHYLTMTILGKVVYCKNCILKVQNMMMMAVLSQRQRNMTPTWGGNETYM